MSEYIKRKDAADLVKLVEERAAAVYAGGGRRRKEIQRAIRETAETFLQAIEDPETLPDEDVERRVYSYLKTEGDYRMVPCEDRMTCANCGFTRPMLRNEQIFRCQKCGAYFTGAGI